MSNNGLDQAEENKNVYIPTLNAEQTEPKVDDKSDSPQQKKVALTPADLQVLVLQTINQVNARKDELTIAVKQLSDLAVQLGRICGQQNKAMENLKYQSNKMG